MKLRRVQIVSCIIRCCCGQFGKSSDAKEEMITIGGEAHTVPSHMGGAATVENTPLARCAKRDLLQSTALYDKSKALKQLN
jgi:hypothetical protein